MKQALHGPFARGRASLSSALLALSAQVLGACASDTAMPAAENSETAAAEPETVMPVVANSTPKVEPEPRDYGRPYELIEGEPMFKVLDEDGLPSIDEPVFVSVDEADAFMDLDETVLGVVGIGGTAKCYSAWQLDSHEIVNDVLDGAPIAATW